MDFKLGDFVVRLYGCHQHGVVRDIIYEHNQPVIIGVEYEHCTDGHNLRGIISNNCGYCESASSIRPFTVADYALGDMVCFLHGNNSNKKTNPPRGALGQIRVQNLEYYLKTRIRRCAVKQKNSVIRLFTQNTCLMI